MKNVSEKCGGKVEWKVELGKVGVCWMSFNWWLIYFCNSSSKN